MLDLREGFVHPRFLISTFVTVLLLGCTTTEPPPTLARLTTVPCRFLVPQSAEGVAFHCGDLVVPENRVNPQTRPITLHVIVFDGNKSGHTTVMPNGGPGYSAERDVMGLAVRDPAFVALYQKFL